MRQDLIIVQGLLLQIMKSFAPIIAIVLLLFVAAFIFLSGSETAPKSSPIANPVMESPVLTSPAVTSGLNPDGSGTITPQASPLTGGDKSTNGQVAPMLADLVGRLEAKVKSDPANVGNQILLAQTYAELGRTDEGITILRKVALTNIETPRVNVVLALLLSKSGKPEDQTAALKLLENASKADASQTGTAELYRGRIFVAQGKNDLAIKAWKAALKKIPATDNARAQLEEELAKIK